MLKFTFLKVCLFGLVAISLPSCFSPKTIVQMDAGPDETVQWNYGRQVVHTQSDSMEAAVFYDTYTKDYLIFDVEITNWASEPVLVSPEKFYFEDKLGSQYPALDPENVILKDKMDANRREAASKNAAVIVGVAAVATVVAVAATSDGDGGNNNGNDGGNYSSFTYIGTNVAPPPPMSYLPPQAQFWEDYALRKTTVRKGYKVTGKVVFLRKDNSLAFSVVLPVGGEVLTADFKQRVIQP